MTAGVVIPCRNEARWLAELLDAIAAQDRQPDQVVVVDDGSVDGTASIVDDWRRRHGDDRVRIISGPARGVAAAKCRARYDGCTVRFDKLSPAADYIAARATTDSPAAGWRGQAWPIEPGRVARSRAIALQRTAAGRRGLSASGFTEAAVG